MDDIVISFDRYISLERAVEALKSHLKDCNNELCYKCGRYKEDYLGACDGCKWKTK